MWETASVAIAMLFATVGPVDVAAMFAALTLKDSPKRRATLALKAVLIAGAVLLTFALLGEKILTVFGITLPALRTSGGVLLLLIGIEMVFARDSGATGTTDDESQEAQTNPDIAVFPIATPLIAGPGAIGAILLLMANAQEHLEKQVAVLGSLVAILIFTLLCLLTASRLQRFLGVTGIHVISRIMGILLAALAMQFIFDGIRDSGLF